MEYGAIKTREKITRKEKREAIKTKKLVAELWKIIKHFFPGLISMLSQVEDRRHASYVDYACQVLLCTRILGAVFQLKSMRAMSSTLNRETCFQNISRILGSDKELDELPHWKTINDYLEKLQPSELEKIIPQLINRLTRMHTFENSLIRDRYWQILVDGTHLFTFDERHCEHCLKKEFKDKEGNVIRTEYYHSVLEAKLVLGDNLIVSIGTEFIVNESEEYVKQDCELKAFYRLAEKLKQHFPRLPICLGLDSLYAAGPVFGICEKYGWKYIIRFKDGSIPSVAEEFEALKDMEPEQTWTKNTKNIEKNKVTYKYVTNISYQTYELNVVEYREQKDDGSEISFVFITNLAIVKKCHAELLVLDGRRRWKIENEGFNEQKNHGLGLEHMFSEDYNAMQNHYYLIQIGHMISQFLEAGLRKIRALENLSCYQIFEDIKESFRTMVLTDEDAESVAQLTQYRIR